MKVADRALVANMAPGIRGHDGLLPHRRADAWPICARRAAPTTKWSWSSGIRKSNSSSARFAPLPTYPSRPQYTKVLQLDLATVEPSLAGPKRPQDRVPLGEVQRTFRQALQLPAKQRGFALSDEQASQTAGRAGRRHDRARCRGDRLDHQLHQHQQPRCDAGRRTAGQERRRSGA